MVSKTVVSLRVFVRACMCVCGVGGSGGGWAEGVTQLVRASDRHAADAGSIPRCGKGFFSPSQLSVQTLLRVSVHPRVQSYALTSVRTLKIL